MTRPALERQAIKQKAGQRMVAVERRAIAASASPARFGETCSSAEDMPAVAYPATSGLADEISKMLRPRPIRFPRELFEGAAR